LRLPGPTRHAAADQAVRHGGGLAVGLAAPGAVASRALVAGALATGGLTAHRRVPVRRRGRRAGALVGPGATGRRPRRAARRRPPAGAGGGDQRDRLGGRFRGVLPGGHPAPGGGLGERALLGRSRLARLLRRLGGGLGGRLGLLGRACRGGDGGGRAFRRGRGSFLGRRRGLLGGAAARRVLLERRALRAAPRRGAGGHHGERGGRVGGEVERLGRLPGRGRPLLRAA